MLMHRAKKQRERRDRRVLSRYMVNNPTETVRRALKTLNFRCSSQTVRRNLLRREFVNLKIKKEKGITYTNAYTQT